MARRLACCTIVATGDMSLLLLDLATGDARPLGVAEQLPERALGE